MDAVLEFAKAWWPQILVLGAVAGAGVRLGIPSLRGWRLSKKLIVEPRPSGTEIMVTANASGASTATPVEFLWLCRSERCRAAAGR